MCEERLEIERFQKAVNELVAGRPGLRVLEAGCGSLSHVKFPQDVHIVGIDISQEQLDKNTYLQERILGDIQSYDFPDSSFDVIVCWDVLEHLSRPHEALKRFARVTRNGGIIVLSAPNLFSPKGIITKFTPYAFHLWFYRNVRGWKEAGTGGNPPFPTYLRASMSPRAIRRFAASNRLAVVHDRVFGYGDSRDVIGHRSRKVDLPVKILGCVLQILSFGAIKPREIQYLMILRKAAAIPQ